ncbi:MAG: DHH family phosphoesterase [Methanobacteriota archaeon]
MKEAADFLSQAARGGQRIVVLCHRNADPDAVASSVVLAEVMTELGAQARAGAAMDVAAVSEALLKSFGREIEVDPKLDFELAILVDTSSLGHMGKYGEKLRDTTVKVAVIDHHKPVEETKQMASFYYVREDMASESELIYRIIERLEVGLKPEQASLLLTGIVSDTGHFRLAKQETFEVVDALLKAGADYNRVLEVLKPPEDISRRVAMLKAAGRSELQRINGRLVSFSELGSFEGDAASLLVRIGADVAFVGSDEKGEFRVSGRARQNIVKETWLHLGEIMEGLGKQYNGTGGGHAGAASASGKGSFEDVKKQIFKILQQKLVTKA